MCSCVCVDGDGDFHIAVISEMSLFTTFMHERCSACLYPLPVTPSLVLLLCVEYTIMYNMSHIIVDVLRIIIFMYYLGVHHHVTVTWYHLFCTMTYDII